MHDIDTAYGLFFPASNLEAFGKLPLVFPSLGAGGWDSLPFQIFGVDALCKKGSNSMVHTDIFFHVRRVKFTEPVRNIQFNVLSRKRRIQYQCLRGTPPSYTYLYIIYVS
jgi:hypothetical protein